MNKNNDLNVESLPTREGKYLAIGVWGREEPRVIDVYRHPKKGLCCFTEDYGGEGEGHDDSTECHVSIQFTGLKFISRQGDLR